MPANPIGLLPGQTQAPVIGSVWDPVVDHSFFLPGAELDALILTVGSTNLSIPAIGTLLCAPPAIGSLTSVAAGTAFAITIPDQLALVGATLATQAVSMEATARSR